jgi:hypothetical protein
MSTFHIYFYSAVRFGLLAEYRGDQLNTAF